jgi:hydroxymethylbilane synthase
LPTKTVRIGTRGSPLALAQAYETRERLAAAHRRPLDDFEIVIIKVMGDQILDRPLSEAGGKGLFTKEIEQALLDGSIDLAVHSSKDMPTVLPDGLGLTAYLPREDVRDAFISPRARSLMDLPPGAVVGTSSLRRQALVKRARPDLKVITYRGNVQTRLAKLAQGEADATLLAYAGLRRLGMEHVVTALFEIDEFLPAVGQGAIGIETRLTDTATRDLIAAIHDEATALALTTERAFLRVLDGSCRTPIAGHARIADGAVRFDGLILKPDGSEAHAVSRVANPADAVPMAIGAGETLRDAGGPGFFAHAA